MAFIFFAPRAAPAARLLDVYIEKDGEVVAHMYYDDGGTADAATVWRYLAQAPIMVDEDVTKIEPEEGRPLSAKLSGRLSLRIQHAGRGIAKTDLSSLLLRRDDAQTQAWYLADEEVERTALLAGLGPPTSKEEILQGYLVMIATCVLVLLACIIATFLLLRGPPAREAE